MIVANMIVKIITIEAQVILKHVTLYPILGDIFS